MWQKACSARMWPLTGIRSSRSAIIQEGDIAYSDLNGDGSIDGRDVKVLGNTFPRTTLGIDINLRYKGWGLYILGYAELGVYKWASNSITGTTARTHIPYLPWTAGIL